MIPLQIYRKFFALFFGISFENESKKGIQFTKNLLSRSMFLSQLFGFLGSVVYFLRNASTDLETSLVCGFQAAGLLISLYAMIVSFFVEDELIGIFLKFKQFYDDSECILSTVSIHKFHDFNSLFLMNQTNIAIIRMQWRKQINVVNQSSNRS